MPRAKPKACPPKKPLPAAEPPSREQAVSRLLASAADPRVREWLRLLLGAAPETERRAG